jgi:hypothetical protein
MGDVDGGVVWAAARRRSSAAAGLAQAAIDAANPAHAAVADRPPRKRCVPSRPGALPQDVRRWLGEKRDWCISRQLWWGHRIPVWRGTCRQHLLMLRRCSAASCQRDDVAAWILLPDGSGCLAARGGRAPEGPNAPPASRCRCACATSAGQRARPGAASSGGLALDPDVLDTWFSSALWPHSTLGWPDPATAKVDPGQTALGSQHGGTPTRSSYYYPGVPGDRPRHHHAVGRAHGDDRALQPRRRAVHRRVPARHDPRRQGRAHVEEQGQRHRPGGHHRGVRRRRDALRGLRDCRPARRTSGCRCRRSRRSPGKANPSS